MNHNRQWWQMEAYRELVRKAQGLDRLLLFAMKENFLVGLY